MGVVSFLNSYNTKKKHPSLFEKKLFMAQTALSEVFRTIATEKNQMFYPQSTPALDQHVYHASILEAAQHLQACLKSLEESAQVSNLQSELAHHQETLRRAITSYTENRLSLPSLLLTCSSIKVSLEKLLL